MRRPLVLVGSAALVAAVVAAVVQVVSEDAGRVLVTAVLVAAAVTSVGLLLLLTRDGGRARAERRRIEGHLGRVDRRLTTVAERAARAARRSSAAAAGVREVQGRVPTLEALGNQNARMTAWIPDLSKRVDVVARDLAAIRTPPPRPPATGADMTDAGRAMASRLHLDGDHPHVVLALQNLGASSMFAGVRTTVLTAATMAVELGLPLRLVVLEPVGDVDAATDAVVEVLRSLPGADALVPGLRVSAPDALDARGHHRDDVWLVTFWTTAWAVGRLVDAGQVVADRVVYLVQDFEPGFYPWGDLHVKAAATYARGFRMVVNSAPLAAYVTARTGAAIDPALVFAPQVDPAPLHAAAAAWTPDPDGRTRVLAYSRPSKPRNMFTLTLATLRTWAEQHHTGDLDPVVLLAGEDHGPVDLGPRVQVEQLGKTTYDGYYDQLARTDAGLALMGSPHPGHLALELPMAGIPTVTNTFEGFRRPWVPGLQLADADPDLLAAALQRAVEAGRVAHHLPADPVEPLGGTLVDAVRAAVATLRR